MSPEGQFICFLIALIFLGVATTMRVFAKAWDAALVAAALGLGFFVLVVNAADAM